MKIKRFSGPDMHQTLRKVRQEMGADAVILSNQRLDEGIEIVAAIDYDESLLQDQAVAQVHSPSPVTKNRSLTSAGSRQAARDDLRYGRNVPAPEAASHRKQKKSPATTASPAMAEMQGEIRSLRSLLLNQLSGMAWEHENRLHPVRIRLMQRLMALGLSPKLSKSLSQQADENQDMDVNWRHMLAKVAHRIPVDRHDILEHGGVVALIGASGVGKTTTIAKLAARYILRHGADSVALITTDNYRVAAHEQLRSYARIMGVPIRVASDENGLRDALVSFHQKGLVLIDTAGMSQRDVQLGKQLSILKHDAFTRIKTYLTLASNTQRGVLDEVVRTFRDVPLSGCVLTKVDETTSLGAVLSTIIEHKLPVAYYSDGQQVPDDLHLARAHTLVTKSVSIMQHVTHGLDSHEVNSLVTGMVASYG